MCYVSCSPLCKLRNVFNNGRSHLACSHFLWSPYVIGQTITFSSCFFLSSFFFFSLPNLSDRRLNVYHRPTLAHGVAQCEFRMQVWNALHAAGCKYRTQKVAISAPSHNKNNTMLIMVALWNRADHYIFILSFILSIFFCLFSSPNLSRRCGLSANLRCRSETCCTRLTENTGRKKSPKIAIWTPSHNFVGLYLHN